MKYFRLAILNHVTSPALVDLLLVNFVCVLCCHMLATLVPLWQHCTIGANGITNGTIGKTLNDICLPLVKILPMVITPEVPGIR